MLQATNLVGFGTRTRYRPGAAHFDGSNDYLTRDADLSGNANGKEGLISAWANIHASAPDTELNIWRGAESDVMILRDDTDSSNAMRIRMRNTSNDIILEMFSTNTYTSADGWFHFLASWDLGNAFAEMYIDDADELAASPTVTDDAIDYTQTDFGAGANPNSNGKWYGDLADILVWHDLSLDITSAANRRLFIDEHGQPVAPRISIAALGTPIGAFYGPLDTWHQNKGSGGGFTENGALTNASTTP